MTRSRSIEGLNLLTSAWDGPDEIRRHKQKLDDQMQSILSQLMMFEGHLRKEQNQIKLKWQEKDQIILQQKDVIVRLKNRNEELRSAYRRLRKVLRAGAEVGSTCDCQCHQVCREYIADEETETSSSQGTSAVQLDAAGRQREDSENIQKCTISLNSSLSKPRRIVESGSIRDLAMLHRRRRASGDAVSAPVTRSNSLPDSKSLRAVQARSKSLTESGLVDTEPPRVNTEAMPVLHSEAVLSASVKSKPPVAPVNSSRHDEEKTRELNGRSGRVHWSLSPERMETKTSTRSESDDWVPQMYDFDLVNEEDDLTELNGESPKFKFVKSPPHPSPNKNPKRPKEFKKRRKLKSCPDLPNWPTDSL